MNSKEKRVIEGSYSAQDVIDMDWAYEAYWTLCWCLNLVDDISDGGLLCDCTQALSFVIKSNSFDEFKNKCNPEFWCPCWVQQVNKHTADTGCKTAGNRSEQQTGQNEVMS